MPEQEDSIEFLAKYKDWVAIKKMGIKPGTTPEEVAFHLAGIRQSLDRKAFEILGIDTASLDSYAAQLVGNSRKSYASLAEVVQKLGSGEAKGVATKACNGKEELSAIATVYLFRKIVQGMGFDLDVNQKMLSKIYPNLKVRKPLGRKPKE